jgi:chromosome segregation ATPase
MQVRDLISELQRHEPTAIVGVKFDGESQPCELDGAITAGNFGGRNMVVVDSAMWNEEMENMKQELADASSEIASVESRLEDAEQENDKLRNKLDEIRDITGN